MLSKTKLLPETLQPQRNPFLDSYVVEFLDLPDAFHENDFRRALAKGIIRNWIKKTDIPAHKIGKLWKFKKSELDEWVRSGKSAFEH